MANDSDLIAATVIDPSGWERAVKRLVEATKSIAGAHFLQQPDGAQLSLTMEMLAFATASSGASARFER